MVGGSGTVYQKDLGKDTLSLARAMTRYDPALDWEAVED
jgi:hypothetical protein